MSVTGSAAPSRPTESPLTRAVLVGASLVILLLLVVAPLGLVFSQTFSQGVPFFFATVGDPIALAAIQLTLLVAAIAVPLNVVFGVSVAWLIAKFSFAGKSVLGALLDLPLAVSPVISGMVFVLLFGAQGYAGPWLRDHDLRVVFALPGIVLATAFVTFPLVARELIPVMQAAGNDEDEAALMLGASGWQTLFRITLPRVKWALLYGILLTNARAMGEFGAVSVVSGHVRGETNTISLHAEILYNEYQYAGAFAMASLLTLLGLVTLVAQQVSAWRARETV